MTRRTVIIPARFRSSRFPGKPLVPLLGKPMVLWVAELAVKAVGAADVFVATDDARIAQVVRDAGFQALITSEFALTGTDRMAEASEQIEADIYINVQGDEPLVNPDDILKIAGAKVEHCCDVINGYCWMAEHERPENVNIPKVITNESDELVYMSRMTLPGYKESANAPERYKKQVCIYACTRDDLRSFRDFGRKSYLEKCEDIEILRFLELNKKIRMVETMPGSLAVDVESDVAGVEAALKKLHGL